jgi:GeoRSP system SPASM domain protein
MNLKELSSPIRVYWDVAPMPEHAAVDYKGISDQIILNKILALQVTEYTPLLSDACLTILDALKDKAIAVSLTVPRSALNASAVAILGSMPLKVLFVVIASADELESVLEINQQMLGKISVGLSFAVTRDNYHQLPNVLSFCLTRKILHLALPMQRVMRDNDCFYLTRQEGEELTSQLQKYALPSDMKLVIHDPFLWRVFYPSVPFPNGGCQAANTMLYISPEAEVYPCPTVPVAIGHLLEMSLKEIICSDAKKDVRNKLIATPDGCAECGELDHCRGGCRGRAYTISSSWNKPDPACT